MIGFGVVMLG
jgi:hypothetical protein